jgi:heterodisulfide reductase subunit A
MIMQNKMKFGQPRIGVFICHCGVNIASKVDVEAVREFALSLPNVVVARTNKFTCSDPGQEQIKKDIQEQNLNRVVVASCSPLLHEATFRRVCVDAGINPFYFHMANIREQVSWVTEDARLATQKAKAIVAGAVLRVALHTPLERKRMPINSDVLVVGAGIAGIHAALILADAQKKVYLVERDPSIGGHMAQLDKTFPTLDCAACILTPKMTQVRSHPNIELLTYSEVEAVDGFVGSFKVKIRRKARYVKEKLCTGCNECTKVCPVDVPSEFDKGLGTRKAIYRPFPQAVPNVFTISRRGTPSCQAGCPLHQNAQGYITLIAQGKFNEALDVILRDNPLPGICGRICTHPCAVNCSRTSVDEPLNVPGLKRFVADYVGDYQLPQPQQNRSEKVAIIGSGPAGLTCAYKLRQMGYQTVIYESLPVAGGMLAVGIPAFRLPQEVLSKEIERLKDIGVDIRLNCQVGKTVTLEKLRKQYSAVFIAIGAHVERKLKIAGEDFPGIWGGVEFLKKVRLEGPVKVGRKVLVIGGGNSALDAARTALRCGGSEVTIVYRRTRAEMPADSREIEQAEREGVKFLFLTAPDAIFGSRDEGVTALQCLKMKLGPPDESGRPSPKPIPDSQFVLSCDTIIVTIGQTPDITSLGQKLGLDTTQWDTFKAGEVALETAVPGVFVGGDCVTGPDVVVNAMQAGKKAAISIDRYLNKLDMQAEREGEGTFQPEYTVDTSGVLMQKQVAMPAIENAPQTTFDEVHTGYTVEQAQTEAKRCLACGICCDCRLCAGVCEPKAIDYNMEDEFREIEVGAIILATGYQLMEAAGLPEYGYGRFPNVYTTLELERLVNASGPTGGEIVLRDGTKPKRVGIIHCVGSRDRRYHLYCSNVCCMLALKMAHLVKERTGAEVFNFYVDMRTAFKGYEEFYDRILQEGVQFVRGRVAEVTDAAMVPSEKGKLIIQVEDTLVGMVRRIPTDMVILALALEARQSAEQVSRLFNISCSQGGWFLERHPKLGPVSTFSDGIFLAGACQGPKDIPETVAQAGAAAAEALALVDRGYIEVEPNTAWIDENACSGCKTCIPLCMFNAITYDKEKKIAVINEALCKGCGTCVATCPSSAAQQNLFTDEEIYHEIEGVLKYV